MAHKDLTKLFRSGDWNDTDQIDRFIEAFQILGRDDLLRLLDVLLAETAAKASLAHRNRCRAFERLVRKRPDPELFGPLVRAMKKGDGTLRTLAADLLPTVNNPRLHSELCDVLAAKNPRLRKLAAKVLPQVIGVQSYSYLLDLSGRRGFVGRIEVVDVVVSTEARVLEILIRVIKSGSNKEKRYALRHLMNARVIQQDLVAGLRTVHELLTSADTAVVIDAISVFVSHCPEGNYFRSIAPFLDNHDLRLVKAAVVGLGRFSSPRSIATLERMFRIGPDVIRLESLKAAERVGSDDVVPLVVDALSHRNLSIRNRAAEVLTELSQAGNVEPGRAIMWLLRSKDSTVRQMAVEILNRVEDPDGVLWPRILEFLRDEDWWVRERVVDALIHMAGSALTPHVAEYLQDASDVVRRFAVGLLERLRDPASLGALIRAAQHDEDWWVREQAVQVCGLLGDARAAPYIVDLMNKTEDLRLVCLRALGELGAVEMAPYVSAVLDSDDSKDVRVAALECLSLLDDADQADVVSRFHDDPHHEIRDVARELLTRWEFAAEDRTLMTIGESLGQLEMLLHEMVVQQGDDLVMLAGEMPFIKKDGQMVVLDSQRISASDVEKMIHPLLKPEQAELLEQMRDVDFSCQLQSHKLRFRANVFQQNSGMGAVFRAVTDTILDLDKLGLPSIVEAFCDYRDGLVIVCGPTGSGKSTTLAAMIDRINRTSARHIITLEDPIEAVHEPKIGLITQREVGTHSPSYHSALAGMLRQDPDVILLGEARDKDTISFAVSAAETGHLVLTSLHAGSADKSIERVVNMFSGAQQAQVRSMLSGSLRAVVCQQLVRKQLGDGRVLVAEILINNDAVARMIRDGKTYQLPMQIETSREAGMQTMDSELKRLLFEDVVSPEDAYVKSRNKDEFVSFLPKGD